MWPRKSASWETMHFEPILNESTLGARGEREDGPELVSLGDGQRTRAAGEQPALVICERDSELVELLRLTFRSCLCKLGPSTGRMGRLSLT